MRRLVTGVAFALVLVGCSDSEPDQPKQAAALVAAPLTAVVEALGDAWEHELVAESGGSQVIAQRLESGTDADLVLLSDPVIAANLHRRGLVSDVTPLATSGLAILVGAAVSASVEGPADLVDTELDLVVPGSTDPLGIYTRTALNRLEQQGIIQEGAGQTLLDDATRLEPGEDATAAELVRSGEADAAIVYASTAAELEAAGADVTVVPWPEEAQVEVVHTGQVTAAAAHPDTARAFLEFALSDEARPIWRDHGFDGPPASVTP